MTMYVVFHCGEGHLTAAALCKYELITIRLPAGSKFAIGDVIRENVQGEKTFFEKCHEIKAKPVVFPPCKSAWLKIESTNLIMLTPSMREKYKKLDGLPDDILFFSPQFGIVYVQCTGVLYKPNRLYNGHIFARVKEKEGKLERNLRKYGTLWTTHVPLMLKFDEDLQHEIEKNWDDFCQGFDEYLLQSELTRQPHNCSNSSEESTSILLNRSNEKAETNSQIKTKSAGNEEREKEHTQTQTTSREGAIVRKRIQHVRLNDEAPPAKPPGVGEPVRVHIAIEEDPKYKEINAKLMGLFLPTASKVAEMCGEDPKFANERKAIADFIYG